MSRHTLEESIVALRSDAVPSERLTRRLEQLVSLESSDEQPLRKRPLPFRLYLGLAGVFLGAVGFVSLLQRLAVPVPKAPPTLALTPNAQTTLERAYQLTKQSLPPAQSRSRDLQVLALVHQARGEPFVSPHPDVYSIYTGSWGEPYECYSTMVRTLIVSAYTKAKRGELSGAVTDSLEAVALAAKVEKGAQFSNASAAVFAQQHALLWLMELVEQMDAGTSQRVLGELDRLEASQASRAEVMEATRWAAYQTFRAKSWEQCMREFGIAYGPRSTVALRATPKSWIISEHLRYLDALKTNVNAPVPPDAFNQRVGHVTGPIQNYFEAKRRAALGRAALRVQLAWHIWRTKHKRNPQSLAALVDAGYLSALPEDPFAPGKPLKLSAEGFLYSVGSDGIDNGGKVNLASSSSLSNDLFFSLPGTRVYLGMKGDNSPQNEARIFNFEARQCSSRVPFRLRVVRSGSPK